MKQLGNLAVICAQRPELLLQLRDGLVSVQAKNRAAMEADGTMIRGSKR